MEFYNARFETVIRGNILFVLFHDEDVVNSILHIYSRIMLDSDSFFFAVHCFWTCNHSVHDDNLLVVVALCMYCLSLYCPHCFCLFVLVIPTTMI